jgi:PKD repeat protein
MPGYFGSAVNGDIYVIDNDTVKLLNHLDGSILSKSNISVQSSFFSNFSVDGEGKVYVKNNLNQMFCFSPDLQTLIWQMSVPNLTYCGPTLAKDGTLVVSGAGTNIKAYRINKPLPPVADFTADSTNIFTGQSIDFFDQSSFQPTEWQWNFPGGSPLTSIEQNPQNIVYNSSGIYEVSLIASNNLGTDTLTKLCYIEVEQSVFVNDEINSLNEFALHQNYPNPFNPSTSIQYAISSRQFVTLKVYDALGNEIETLVNEEKPAGTYEVEFNSSTLSGSVSAKSGYASGVYFYQLKAGQFIETKKMLLLK